MQIDTKPSKTFKQYYQENVDFREKFKKHQNEKVSCEICGATCCRGGLAKHKQSKKHLKAVEAKANTPIVANIDQTYNVVLDLSNVASKEKFLNFLKNLEN
jgi:hypothetical protein